MKTTLGSDLFRSRHLADIRAALEQKFIGCVILGRAEYLLPPDWLTIPDHQALYFAWQHCRTAGPDEWVSVPGPKGEIAHLAMVNASKATFGVHDVAALHAIRRLETLELTAREGGLLW